MTYWHGGASGLRPGDFLLPPTMTGVKSAVDYCPDLDTSHVRRDRVYITTDKLCARMFAAMWPGVGFVYEVRPVGEVEIDPDYLDDEAISFMVPKAEILHREKPTAAEVRAIRSVLLR